MKLTEQEKMAITTTIKVASQICDEYSKGKCDSCPFWGCCEYHNMGDYLDHLFADVFKKY